MSVVADVFKADPDYLANEEKYKQIRDGTVCVIMFIQGSLCFAVGGCCIRVVLLAWH